MVKISVYITNGNVFEYEVGSEAKAREHAEAITRTGYRSVQEDNPTALTWYPARKIEKVVIHLEEKSTTKYFDTVVST